jgi:S1-C subfamily serine protease
MYDCQLEPCYFAIGVMALEGLETGPSFGTCFTVSQDGLVMTALHVVDTDDVIHVQFADGTVAEAEVERFSEAHDVAVLSTGQARSDYLTFASTDDLTAGDPVFTIGFPAPEILGSEPKFTDGVISALSGADGDDAFLQMSAPVQPGNSGGPLMNFAGQVVGVVDSTMGSRAFEAQTGSLPQNINWAVKGSYAALLLGEPPAPLPPTTRDEAIQRTQAAVCAVVVGEMPEEDPPAEGDTAAEGEQARAQRSPTRR